MDRETKRTPGKWEVIEHSWSDTSIICGDYTVATKSIYDEATEETQEQLEDEVSANFKLMAASPELLEALKGLLSWSAHLPFAADDKVEFARDVIKKIEG